MNSTGIKQDIKEYEKTNSLTLNGKEITLPKYVDLAKL